MAEALGLYIQRVKEEIGSEEVLDSTEQVLVAIEKLTQVCFACLAA